MKGNQESLSTVVVKYGPPDPASSSTDGSRQGLWQTATVSTGAHRQKDGSMIDKLDQQVKNWATPRTEHDSGMHRGQPDTLHSQIKTWATPRCGKTTDENPDTWKARQEKGDVSTMPLTAQVKQSWPTPASSTGDGGPHGLDGGSGARSMLPKEMKNSGKLNPRWVETLMGLPVGWTMPSCASPVTIEPTNSASSATE